MPPTTAIPFQVIHSRYTLTQGMTYMVSAGLGSHHSVSAQGDKMTH